MLAALRIDIDPTLRYRLDKSEVGAAQAPASTPEAEASEVAFWAAASSATSVLSIVAGVKPVAFPLPPSSLALAVSGAETPGSEGGVAMDEERDTTSPSAGAGAFLVTKSTAASRLFPASNAALSTQDELLLGRLCCATW